MVYRGKPSAACGECRKRRSRCDQALPACGQCTKAGRICPGYRNTVDLMFHDESRSIARRNRNRSSGHAEDQDIVGGQHLDEQAYMLTTMTTPVKLNSFVPCQPLDDLGVNFFMTTYVGDDPSVSQLYYLPKLYAQCSSSNPALQKSITATGLAGYAKTAGRKDVQDAARVLYVSAIRSINAAISDPTAVVQDSTLMSIVMAAMFEVLAVPRLSDMQDSNKHLDGAIAVALLMLKQKKQTDITYRIISATMQSIIINSWIMHTPLPANFTKLKIRLGSQPRLHLHSLYGDFLNIMPHLIEFREALKQGVFTQPIDIIERALAIDRIFKTFADTMPLHGRFQTHRILGQDVEQLTFNGYYHVYAERFTVHLWNNLRASRMRLHQVIHKQCQILLSSPAVQHHGIWKTQQADCEASIVEFAIEICATVPQLTGYTEQLEARRLSRSRSSKSTDSALQHWPRLKKISGPGTMQYTAHFGDAPSPFRRGNPPPHTSTRTRTPTSTSTSTSTIPTLPNPTAENQHNESHGKSSAAPPHPASVYHMLFQLYSLRRIALLPAPFRHWVQSRIDWMENICDPDDLLRLQGLVAKWPGDGFLIDDEE